MLQRNDNWDELIYGTIPISVELRILYIYDPLLFAVGFILSSFFLKKTQKSDLVKKNCYVEITK